jgi:hypothetical protein
MYAGDEVLSSEEFTGDLSRHFARDIPVVTKCRLQDLHSHPNRLLHFLIYSSVSGLDRPSFKSLLGGWVSYTHTLARARRHTRIHTHTQTRAHAHTSSHLRARTPTRTQTHTHTHTRLVVGLCESGERWWKFPGLHNGSEFLVVLNNHQTRN